MESPALCGTSSAIPTADESNHSAMGTLHPHGNATCILYVTLRCAIPPPKFAPSLTGDINPQSSHWNHGKMKTAYDSAYIQKRSILPSPSKPLLCISTTQNKHATSERERERVYFSITLQPMLKPAACVAVIDNMRLK